MKRRFKMNRKLKTKIPSLPAEMIVHISKYLNIQDKLKLRLVNKSFKSIFDNLIKLDCLSFTSEIFNFNKNWFYTNRINNEIDLIDCEWDCFKINENTLNELFKKSLFSNLKKLFFRYWHEINLNETINQLKHLEELDMKYEIKSNSILLLPKLRILKIKKYRSFLDDHFKIELETPSLSILRCEDFENYQFNYPEKIIYFDTDLIKNKNEILGNKLEIFKNLEYLVGNDNSEFKPILLTKLNHLKEIHFNYGGLNVAKEIYKYKSKNLRIFLHGIDYENVKEMNQDQLIAIDSMDLIFENYSKTIDKLPFIEEMDFDKLSKFLIRNKQITLDNIINKFPNIKKITANNLNEINIDYFFEFLSKCNNLYNLEMKLSFDDYDEQFNYLNLLPDICKGILNLDLSYLNVEEPDDLDFLENFTNLFDVSLGEISNLHRFKEKFCSICCCSITANYVHRERTFYFSYVGHFLCDDHEFYNSKELIEFFDYLIDECNYE